MSTDGIVNSTAARGYPRGDLRVSDADRDRAVSELSVHYQAGRLTAEEFDERSGQALRARTGRELTGLLADLPLDRAAMPGAGAGPDRAAAHLPGYLPAVPIAIVAAAIVAVIAQLAVGGNGHRGLGALVVPALAVLFVSRRLARGRGHSHGQDQL